jgi:hypothetical protein
VPIDFSLEILHLINKIKRNQNNVHYSYMLYDFDKIKFSNFRLRYKDPMNPRDLIPVDLDLPASGKTYDAASNLSTVLTQLSRYSKNRNIKLDKTWEAIKGNLQNEFKKRFLKREPTKVTNHIIAKHLNPVINKLIKNGGVFKELNLSLNPLNETFTIRFFLKTIQKVVMSKSLDADKCGQGISAWPKILNAVFCPLFRAIEECFINDLKENVFYDNGIPETEFDAMVARFWNHDFEIFTSDCKEYDANQDASTQFLEDCFLGMYIDEKTMRIYRAMRLKSKQKSMFVTLVKEALKDSGESATLLTNTVLKMFFTMLTTEVSNVAIEAFKGDDSVINAEKIKLTNLLVKLDNTLHLPIISDMDYPIHGDMGGWFYSEHGIIPDILKLVAKFIGKDFNNKKGKLTEWERKNLNVEGLSYFEQVKIAMSDKEKFLNEKKLIYLRKIYLDLYNISYENFYKLMSFYYWTFSEEANYENFRKFNAIYISDSGYQRLDLTESDKNRKRIIQTYKDVEDIKL